MCSIHINGKGSQTNYETGNTQSIMDGNINQFIRAYLLNSINNEIRENEYYGRRTKKLKPNNST